MLRIAALSMLIGAGLSSTSKVHVLCETNFRSQATIVAKPESKFNAETCVYITKMCGMAEGKIFWDRFSRTGAFISSSNSSCR